MIKPTGWGGTSATAADGFLSPGEKYKMARDGDAGVGVVGDNYCPNPGARDHAPVKAQTTEYLDTPINPIAREDEPAHGVAGSQSFKKFDPERTIEDREMHIAKAIHDYGNERYYSAHSSSDNEPVSAKNSPAFLAFKAALKLRRSFPAKSVISTSRRSDGGVAVDEKVDLSILLEG